MDGIRVPKVQLSVPSFGAGSGPLKGPERPASSLVFDVPAIGEPITKAAVEGIRESAHSMMTSLESRRKLLAVQNAIQHEVDVMEASEADQKLAPLITNLSSFAGSGNWAGVYQTRRQILEDPDYLKSREVRRVLSELDNGLRNWETAITTDGREVNFHEVSRMVGSGDKELQKEGLRILALNSENGLGWVDQIPLKGAAAKDPMFRLHLKTFIKENPAIDRSSFEEYNAHRQAFLSSFKYQYRKDPVLAAELMNSPKIQEELRKLRDTTLRGKPQKAGSWAPPPSNSDAVIGTDELHDLADFVQTQVEYSGAGFFKRMFTNVGARREVQGRRLFGSPGLQQVAQDTGELPAIDPKDAASMVQEDAQRVRSRLEEVIAYRDLMKGQAGLEQVDPEAISNSYNKLTASLAEFDQAMISMGLPYVIEPQHLFSTREYEAISRKISVSRAKTAVSAYKQQSRLSQPPPAATVAPSGGGGFENRPGVQPITDE